MNKHSDLPRLEREAQFLQALAHPVRLRILDFLGEEEKCGCEIEPHINLDKSTISRHLQILKRAGVLLARKEGVRVLYKIDDRRIMNLRRRVGELITARVQRDLASLGARHR
ncbi:MAG: winged helix-turn-helix transcriptional regulator [Deltaproteobacteria bacterium]|nr:winged helix-turn-helix transcriptional regulator [Deltaproteobacteria bacterium]